MTHVEVGDNVLNLGSSRNLVELLNSLLKLFLLPSSNVDLGTVLRETGGHHLSDTRASTSHEHNLSSDIE